MKLTSDNTITRRLSDIEFKSLAIIAANKQLWLEKRFFGSIVRGFNNLLMMYSKTKFDMDGIKVINDLFIIEKIIMLLSFEERFLNVFDLTLKCNYNHIVIYKELLKSLLTKVKESNYMMIDIDRLYNEMMKDKAYFFIDAKEINRELESFKTMVDIDSYLCTINTDMITYYFDYDKYIDIPFSDIDVTGFKYCNYSLLKLINDEDYNISTLGNYDVK